jgi:hypothetical protein
MTQRISRRGFTTLASGIAIVGAVDIAVAQDKPKVDETKKGKMKAPSKGPVEAAFQRDYAPPGFAPRWAKPQINRTMLQDFVIFAHSEFSMVKKLVEKEPMLVNGLVDWGGGDWESGLGGATHMGRRDIVEFLLEKGARIDIFCAAMMGQLEAIQGFLKLQPKLIDARGPHGITLHDHAYIGGKQSEKVFDYLMSIRKVEIGRMAKTFRSMGEKSSSQPKKAVDEKKDKTKEQPVKSK